MPKTTRGEIMSTSTAHCSQTRGMGAAMFSGVGVPQLEKMDCSLARQKLMIMPSCAVGCISATKLMRRARANCTTKKEIFTIKTGTGV